MIAAWAIAAVLVGLSVWAGVVDARSRRIPNACCVYVALCGMALQIVRVQGGVAPVLGEPLACVELAAAVLVAGVCLELAYRRLSGRAGLGMGDIKYVAAWAVSLGWLVAPALVVACLLGAAWGLATRQRTFAFGLWLSLAFFLQMLMVLVTSS